MSAFSPPTPEQEAARTKWVSEVCELMSQRFNLQPDGNGMAMIRMMAEVASYGMFCRCGAFSTSVCLDCCSKARAPK